MWATVGGVSRELEVRYEGYRFTGRRPFGLDEQNRMWGEVDVVGYDEERGEPADWKATIQYVVDISDVRFLQVTLEPTGDDIPSTIWKKFPIGDIRAYLRATFAERPELGSMLLIFEKGGAEFSPEERKLVDEQKRRAEQAAEVLRTSKPTRGSRKGKKRKQNDEHWRAITRAYNDAVRTGGRRGIYQHMADYINEEEETNYEAKDVKWMVERARVYEWLSRPGHGSVGGGYGRRYIEWMEEQEE